MNNNYIQRFALSFFVLLLGFSGGSLFAQETQDFNPDSARYFWPTNASNALSGTFAETRSRHFHAALDIKTWGQRGYPVYATRSGTLYRLAVGPTGYGKVLYLKHKDGSYSLYAHLLRFNKQLQQIADSIRFSSYRSSFDMIVDTMDIYVKKGQQIALSGASGIGPPHLHFELRTPDQDPFNPLLTNLKIEDTIPPSFSNLAVVPLDISTKIEGENRIYTKTPNRKSGYTDFGTIETSGPVGLAADMFDQANGVPNVYAVYKISMSVDGREVFYSQADQFSYDETDQMHLDRVYQLLQSTGRGFQRLYVKDGNTLPFYKTWGNNGKLNLSPGKHEIRIQITDFNGNTRQARLTLQVTGEEAKAGLPKHIFASSTSGAINPNNWTWFNDWVNIPVDQFYQLNMAPLINSPTTPLYYENDESISVNLAASPQFYFQTVGQNFFITRRVYPKEISYLITPDETAYVSFPARTFYDTTSVAITKQTLAPDSIEVQLFPDSNPIRKAFKLAVQLDSVQLTDSTLSFYKTYPDSDYLSPLQTQRNGTYLTAHPSSLGRYLILPDHDSPTIYQPRIVRSPDNKRLVYIPARDRRSGIDYERTEIFVNGVRGLTEYEPEDRRLVYYHPSFMPKSSNKVKIITYDHTGNKTMRTFTVRR